MNKPCPAQEYIVLLSFNSVQYSRCFSTFYQSTVLVKILNFFLILVSNILTGELTHSTSKKQWCYTTQLCCLKYEASIMLHCQLYSTHYTVVQIKIHYYVIKVATMENTNNFRYKRKPLCATAKLTLFTVSKD